MSVSRDRFVWGLILIRMSEGAIMLAKSIAQGVMARCARWYRS